MRYCALGVGHQPSYNRNIADDDFNEGEDGDLDGWEDCTGDDAEDGADVEGRQDEDSDEDICEADTSEDECENGDDEGEEDNDGSDSD